MELDSTPVLRGTAQTELQEKYNTSDILWKGEVLLPKVMSLYSAISGQLLLFYLIFHKTQTYLRALQQGRAQ